MIGFVVTPGLEHLLPAYQTELAQDSKTLAELRNGSLDELAYVAHGLGGKCAMVGDHDLAEHLYEMERQALAGRQVQTLQMLDQFLAILDDRRP